MIDLCDTIGLQLPNEENASLLRLHSSATLSSNLDKDKEDIDEMEELKEFIAREMKCKESESFENQKPNLDSTSQPPSSQTFASSTSKGEKEYVTKDAETAHNRVANDESFINNEINQSDQEINFTASSKTDSANCTKMRLNLTSSSLMHQLKSNSFKASSNLKHNSLVLNSNDNCGQFQPQASSSSDKGKCILVFLFTFNLNLQFEMRWRTKFILSFSPSLSLFCLKNKDILILKFLINTECKLM